MHILASWLLPPCVAVVFTLAACGGRVVVDGSGGSSNGSGGNASSSSSGAGASTTTSSSSVTTVSSSSGGTGGGCPNPFPGVEAPCDLEGQTCKVPNACCGGQALCKGGFWTFLGPFCNIGCAPDCGPGGFACQNDKVCATFLGKITTYQCADDPCPPQALACSCAKPLCAAQAMVCNNIQDGFKVLCDCNGPCN